MSEQHAVAIDIGGTKVDIALADGAGRILDRVRLDTCADDGPDQAIERILDAVRRLAARSDDAVTRYAAVCAGVVRPDGVLFAPNLPGWEHVALAERFQHGLGVPHVAVANDVYAGALAELRHGALRGADPGLYLSLGTGVAAAVTFGGQVSAGAHRAAGELAYVALDSTAPADIGRGRAPLEEIVGGRALGDRASAVLGQPVTAAELFARTDPPARKLVDEALDVLGVAIANAAVLLDPARVVIGGGMMASAETIVAALTAHLQRAVPFPPDVRVARFAQDASLYGAVALALDAGTDRVSAPVNSTGSAG